MKQDYTILVSSCDGYRDLWDPFFTILKANWPAVAQRDILLITEREDYAFDGLQIRTLPPYPQGVRPTWSQCIKDHLQAIESEYVLFFLEDFFLEAPVNEAQINACLAAMQANKKIAHFSFEPTFWQCIDDGKYDGFVRRKHVAPYKVNTQVGLWRKKELLALLRTHESPWEFEVYASIRARLRPSVYYCAKNDAPQAFVYDTTHGGAVHLGKWSHRAVQLMQQHGVQIDVSKRGMDENPYDLDNVLTQTEEEKSVIGRLKIRLNVIRKHWRSLI